MRWWADILQFYTDVLCGYKKNVEIAYNAAGEEEFTQTVRVPSYWGGGGWPNRHITFIVAEKA